MKKITLLTILPALVATAAVGDPPKVLSSSPEFWAVGVNPSQKSASLTFDQPMRQGFSDWFGRDSHSPPSTMQTTVSPDRLTFMVDVKLQAGKVYVMGLNERGIPGVGFQTEKGFSLPPTYLVFQTMGTPTPEDAPPRVIKSVPSNGAKVDAARTPSLGLMFDQPMGTKKHGLRLFENGKQIDLAKVPFAYSVDGRTFTLPCNLKPGTQYRLELNSVSDIGFSRANRIPLWPVQISFSTQ